MGIKRWIMIQGRTLDELAELTEERLDMLAGRYNDKCIHNLTGATFGAYVASPGYYDAISDELVRGCGLQTDESHPSTWIVLEPTRRGWLDLQLGALWGLLRVLRGDVAA